MCYTGKQTEVVPWEAMFAHDCASRVDTNDNMITPSLQLVTSDSLEARLVLITHVWKDYSAPVMKKHPGLCEIMSLHDQKSPDRCINNSNQTLYTRNHSEHRKINMIFVTKRFVYFTLFCQCHKNGLWLFWKHHVVIINLNLYKIALAK